MGYSNTNFAITIAAIGAAFFLLCPIAQGQTVKAGSVHIVWPWWFHDDGGSGFLRELSDAFDKKYPTLRGSLAVHPDDYASVGRFSDKSDPFGVLIHQAPDRDGRIALQRRFPPDNALRGRCSTIWAKRIFPSYMAASRSGKAAIVRNEIQVVSPAFLT